jgi:hypothetical protein
MATAGSFPDPLSPKVRGQALQWLNEIDMQLSKGVPLSPEQEKFVSGVYNTWEIEGKGAVGPGAPAAATGTGVGGGYGNLPNPETGEVATDAAIGESKAREAAIRMAKKSIQEVIHPPVSQGELAFAKDVEGRWATATPEEKNRATSILQRAYYTPTAEEDAWFMEKATEYYDTVLSPKPTIKK